MNTVYLILGGNLGDRKENLFVACDLIEKDCGKIIQSSAIYESAPWGFEHQNSFLNKVICIETEFEAAMLMQKLLAIEQVLGRVRTGSMGARSMDIDILFFNDDVINSEELCIPHPRMASRRFVLEPLVEIAPNFVHPIFKKDILCLLAECVDNLKVQKFNTVLAERGINLP